MLFLSSLRAFVSSCEKTPHPTLSRKGRGLVITPPPPVGAQASALRLCSGHASGMRR